jgi:ribA/ribD-fused uncharacterized protein
MTQINFYSSRGEFGCFSNFSRHPVKLEGHVYPTSEHYYQSKKFEGTKHESEVRKASGPMEAARLGRDKRKPLRRDWESVKDNIMYKVLKAKFTQHEDLKQTLLNTGDNILCEHTENDFYWADGGDGSGKNMLGKLLMKLRSELRGD